MKKLLSLFVFVPFIIIAMDPSRFTSEHIEAFKRGQQPNEQESIEWVSNNKNEISELLLNLSKVKQELKEQLGHERYNALVEVWDIATVQELAKECLNRKRPFEFNKKIRTLVTDTDIITCLPNDPIQLTLIQFQALSLTELALVSAAMVPNPALLTPAPKQKSKNLFSRLKKWITRK